MLEPSHLPDLNPTIHLWDSNVLHSTDQHYCQNITCNAHPSSAVPETDRATSFGL